MPEQQPDYAPQILSEFNTKIRDLEERQRLLKERALLIGKNLIESKEESDKDITELKINVEEMKRDIKKIKETIISLSEEMGKKARKTEIQILANQMKMFQPLEFARIQDVKKMIGK